MKDTSLPISARTSYSGNFTSALTDINPELTSLLYHCKDEAITKDILPYIVYFRQLQADEQIETLREITHRIAIHADVEKTSLIRNSLERITDMEETGLTTRESIRGETQIELARNQRYRDEHLSDNQLETRTRELSAGIQETRITVDTQKQLSGDQLEGKKAELITQSRNHELSLLSEERLSGQRETSITERLHISESASVARSKLEHDTQLALTNNDLEKHRLSQEVALQVTQTTELQTTERVRIGREYALEQLRIEIEARELFFKTDYDFKIKISENELEALRIETDAQKETALVLAESQTKIKLGKYNSQQRAREEEAMYGYLGKLEEAENLRLGIEAEAEANVIKSYLRTQAEMFRIAAIQEIRQSEIDAGMEIEVQKTFNQTIEILAKRGYTSCIITDYKGREYKIELKK